MLRAARHAVAWMSVCRSVGVSDIRVSMRLRGAGYRRYSSRPELNIYLLTTTLTGFATYF